jgi:hypothetical protein
VHVVKLAGAVPDGGRVSERLVQRVGGGSIVLPACRKNDDRASVIWRSNAGEQRREP